jgi:hypothetical protein
MQPTAPTWNAPPAGSLTGSRQTQQGPGTDGHSPPEDRYFPSTAMVCSPHRRIPKRVRFGPNGHRTLGLDGHQPCRRTTAPRYILSSHSTSGREGSHEPAAQRGCLPHTFSATHPPQIPNPLGELDVTERNLDHRQRDHGRRRDNWCDAVARAKRLVGLVTSKSCAAARATMCHTSGTPLGSLRFTAIAASPKAQQFIPPSGLVIQSAMFQRRLTCVINAIRT